MKEHIKERVFKSAFYMVRNRVYLKKKLGSGTPILDIIKLWAKVMFFETNKREKIEAIIKGIKEGHKMKV